MQTSASLSRPPKHIGRHLPSVLAALAILFLPACEPDEDPGPTDIVATVVWADTGEPLQTGSVSFAARDWGGWDNPSLVDTYGPFSLEGSDRNPVRLTIPGTIVRETSEYFVYQINVRVVTADTSYRDRTLLGSDGYVGVGRRNDLVLRVPRP